MPGFQSKSLNAAPVWLADDDGNALGSSGNPLNVSSTGGSGAASQQVQGNVANGAADTGNPVKIGGVAASATPTAVTAGQRVNSWFTVNGAQIVTLADAGGNTSLFRTPSADGNSAFSGFIGYAQNLFFNGTTWDRTRGDSTGTWVHAPPSTAASQSGTIATSGATATVTFTNTTDTEVMNPSTATLWASWGTPAVNGAGSFPIIANGSYRPPSRVAGTLTLLSTAASQTYTAYRYS